MKKLVLTAAIVMGMAMCASAQNAGGGLFQKGGTSNRDGEPSSPALPAHGLNTNQPADTPIGGGALLLIGFGAAYALGKRKE